MASPQQPPQREAEPARENFYLGTLDTAEWGLVSIFGPDGTERHDWPRTGMGNSGPSVRLSFPGAGLFGLRVCNGSTFRYRWWAEDGGIRAEPVFQTMAACDDQPLMQMEAWAHRQLSQIRRYSLYTAAGGTLRLRLSFADGSRWELQGSP